MPRYRVSWSGWIKLFNEDFVEAESPQAAEKNEHNGYYSGFKLMAGDSLPKSHWN